MMIKGELEKKMKKMIIISSVIVVLLLTMSIFLRIYLNHIVRNNMIDQVDNTVDKYIHIISKKYPVNTFYSWAFPRCLRRSAQCYKITLG